MKKKFMMVTLLLGTLFLGACVDDNETASVSAVREATAKQLKSVAAMNRAEAEAQKTLAAAQVALLQAKAAAEKANAEYNNALVEQRKKSAELIELQKEGQSIEIEKRKAQLEAELAQLEVTKQQAQKTLASIEAQMKQAEIDNQTALLNMQKELVKAQQDLLDCEEALAAAKSEAERQEILAQRALLETLANEYSDAVNALIQAKIDLSDAKSDLIALQNGLLDAEAAKEMAIIDNNNLIAQYEKQIEALKQYANYTENVDSLKAKLYELQAKQGLLYDQYMTSRTAWEAVEPDNTASKELTDSLEYKDKFSTFARFGYDFGSYNDGDEFVEVDYAICTILRDYVENAGYGYPAASFTYRVKRYVYDDYAYPLGDSLTVDFPTIPDLRGTGAEQLIDNRKDQYNTTIKNYQDYIKELNRKCNGAAVKGDYPSYSGTDLTEACKNYTDSTAVIKAKYEAETDETKKAEYRTQYQEALDLENNAKDNIEWLTEGVERYQISLENLIDQWDMLVNYAKYQEELQKAIDERNELQVQENAPKVAAWIVYRDKSKEYYPIQNEIDAITLILNGHNNGYDPENGDYDKVAGAEAIAQQIANLEDEIENLKAKNEDYREIENTEELIAMLEKEVDALEAIVKSWEVIVAQTKADLDAEIAKNQTAEE